MLLLFTGDPTGYVTASSSAEALSGALAAAQAASTSQALSGAIAQSVVIASATALAGSAATMVAIATVAGEAGSIASITSSAQATSLAGFTGQSQGLAAMSAIGQLGLEVDFSGDGLTTVVGFSNALAESLGAALAAGTAAAVGRREDFTPILTPFNLVQPRDPLASQAQPVQLPGSTPVFTKFYKGFTTRNYEDGGAFSIYNIDCVEEDLLNEIFTARGDRLRMVDSFGTRIPITTFEISDPTTHQVIRSDLEQVFNRDPRVSLVDLQVIPADDRHALLAIAKLNYIELNVTKNLQIEIPVR